MKKYLVAGLLVLVAAVGIAAPQPIASAVSANDWRAGNIINDPLFFNGSAMTQQDIQNFLNAQVPTCDTWGTQLRSDGRTRAAYGTSVGVPPPYICIKDYYENPTTHETNFNASATVPTGAKSAAQIIYEAAVRYNVNPKVILVTIKKEAAENLLGDDWPWQSQYRSAMGYGCPDTAPCDTEYYGFYNQVENAARQFRQYATYPEDYRYKTGHVNFIQYNPNSACSGTNVFVESQATAGLYNYTPYQPNTAALANMYGTGDGCSAYGNRNFWRIWSDWFGSTTDERLYYRVIQGDQSGEVYLQTHQGKYYVPSYSLLAEWGMGPEDVIGIPQSQVNAIPTKNELSNVLTDGSGLLYLVEGGGLRQVTSPNHTAAWGIDTSKMVESLGLAYALPKKEPLGRFMTLQGGDGSIWLADGDSRHYMASGSLLYAWGYYPGITSSVSQYFFEKFVEKRDTTQFATIDGTQTWAIDASTKRSFKNQQARDAYVGQVTPTRVRQQTLNMLGNDTPLTIFAINSSTRQWFMVDGGQKRYIPKGELAALWGKPDNEQFSLLTYNFMASLPTGVEVSYTARSPSSATYWLIAKEKHPIPNGDIYTSLSGLSTAPEIYSDALINSLPVGKEASGSIGSTQSPYNYSYLLDTGTRRYPATAVAQQAWLVNTLTVPYQLVAIIPERSFISSVVIKDSADQAYYVEKGTKYPIPPELREDWGVTATTPQINNAILNTLLTGQPVTSIVRTSNDKVYVVSGGKKIIANKHRDLLLSRAISLPLTLEGIAGNDELSFLISSTDSANGDMWLLNNGERLALPLFEQRVALGYLSNGIKPTKLSPAILQLIPASSATFNNLIQKTGSGIKFLNFGNSLGFPDSATLIAYTNPAYPILQVSPSIFDTIPLTGNTSRVVYDDLGRYWWIENGQRKYITSWSAYYRLAYPLISSRYLFGTTMNLIPVSTSPIQ